MVKPSQSNWKNLLALYYHAKSWELSDGYAYYDRQRERLRQRGETYGKPVESVVGAFCALSPNSAELTNYIALDICMLIVAGALPESTPVPGYPLNKSKALRILRGADSLDIIRGQKVLSFYHNTMNPDNDQYITVDGHMLGAWSGERKLLRRESYINSATYQLICKDFRQVARMVYMSPPRFQSILWLVWKRLNDILYNPQLPLPLPGKSLDYPLSSLLGAGASIRKAISTSRVAPQDTESSGVHSRIDLLWSTLV